MTQFYLSEQQEDEHKCSKLAAIHTFCMVSRVLSYMAEQGLKYSF